MPMPRKKKLIQIPLDSLALGRHQARVRDVDRDIDELAQSIRVRGLIEPIVVCPSADKSGKYEVLAGQRRLLACKKLGWTEIDAVVQETPVDASAGKVISLTENLVRRDLPRKDKIDACTDLYHRYGSIKDVVSETGLPEREVREYVKFDRLDPALKRLVTSERVTMQAALRAQDAASAGGELNIEDAKKFAIEMSPLSGQMQADIVRMRQESPDRDADEIIEDAKSGKRVVQLNVKLSVNIHTALSEYAKTEGNTISDAARDLIESGLSDRGFFGDA